MLAESSLELAHLGWTDNVLEQHFAEHSSQVRGNGGVDTVVAVKLGEEPHALRASRGENRRSNSLAEHHEPVVLVDHGVERHVVVHTRGFRKARTKVEQAGLREAEGQLLSLVG